MALWKADHREYEKHVKEHGSFEAEIQKSLYKAYFQQGGWLDTQAALEQEAEWGFLVDPFNTPDDYVGTKVAMNACYSTKDMKSKNISMLDEVQFLCKSLDKMKQTKYETESDSNDAEPKVLASQKLYETTFKVYAQHANAMLKQG
jgi:hypothetical protein